MRIEILFLVQRLMLSHSSNHMTKQWQYGDTLLSKATYNIQQEDYIQIAHNVGLEPITLRLRVSCSTDWANRVKHVSIKGYTGQNRVLTWTQAWGIYGERSNSKSPANLLNQILSMW